MRSLVVLPVLLIALVVAPTAEAAELFIRFTPGAYNWTVPAGVTEVNVRLLGARGASSRGGETRATLTVVPGQVLQVRVGGEGLYGPTGADYNVVVAGGAGGYNGGGNGGPGTGKFGAGGGGGASDIRTSDALSSRLVVAGGGGGRGTYDPGGDGGGASGGDAYRTSGGNFPPDSSYGKGGTPTAGGAPGAALSSNRAARGGSAGGFGSGGSGGDGTAFSFSVSVNEAGGGGGGGGWYGGGGGGTNGGGGGGSSYGPPGAVMNRGVNNSDGRVEIYTTPARPTGLSTPAVGRDRMPYVRGTLGSPDGEINLYTTPYCTGPSVGSGYAASFTGQGIRVTTPVAENAATTFYASVTDGLGQTACSTDSATYTNDTIAPAAPSLVAPASPANGNAPVLTGEAEAGTVRIYATPDCSGPVAAEGLPATLTVADDSASTFSARVTDAAGNASPCSSAVSYVEDSTAPAGPTLAGPAGPANANQVTLTGSADGGVLRVYPTENCSGAAIAAALPATVTVADDSTTRFSANVTDAAGNVSSCADAVTYVEDSTAPAAPRLTLSPPQLGVEAEPGASVRVFASADCSGPETSTTVSVPATFSATATDAAGNVSACSAPLTYAPAVSPIVRVIDAHPPAPDSTPVPAVTALKVTPGLSGRIQVAVDGTRLRVAAFVGKVQIGTANQTVRAGTATFTVKLTRAGKKLLRKKAKTKVRVVVRATAPGMKARELSRIVVVRR